MTEKEYVLRTTIQTHTLSMITPKVEEGVGTTFSIDLADAFSAVNIENVRLFPPKAYKNILPSEAIYQTVMMFIDSLKPRMDCTVMNTGILVENGLMDFEDPESFQVDDINALAVAVSEIVMVIFNAAATFHKQWCEIVEAKREGID